MTEQTPFQLELKVPLFPDDFDEIERATQFNQEEEKFWDDLCKRRDEQFAKRDFQGKLGFNLKELIASYGLFGERIAIERQLKYSIGFAYEWLGTKILVDESPLKRTEMLMNAAYWYQASDETIGYYTDSSLGQAESCLGAASFARKAGLEKKFCDAISNRGIMLIETILGQLTDGKADVTIVSKNENIELLKKIADSKVESAVKGYHVKVPSDEERESN